jgi:CcmD family protein
MNTMQLSYLAYGFFEIMAQTKPTSEQVETGFVYVIAAFIAIWLFIFGYLFWLHRRQESLRQEVTMLRQEAAERTESETHLHDAKPEQPAGRVGRNDLGG